MLYPRTRTSEVTVLTEDVLGTAVVATLDVNDYIDLDQNYLCN